jgi:hypothetical protein
VHSTTTPWLLKNSSRYLYLNRASRSVHPIHTRSIFSTSDTLGLPVPFGDNESRKQSGI